MQNQLQAELAAIAGRERRCRRAVAWMRCWLAAALAAWGLILLAWLTGWRLAGAELAVGGIAFLAAAYAGWRARAKPADRLAISRKIEAEAPHLQGLLLTAAEQRPDSDGHWHYLQQRVLAEAEAANQRRPWGQPSIERLFLVQCAHALTLGFLLVSLTLLHHASQRGQRSVSAWLAGVKVSPGDTEIERGNRLVVLARFERTLPRAATLIVQSKNGTEQRIPLTRSLDDPLFGGSVPDLQEDVQYAVEFDGGRTRDFRATVFEFPKLERADARLVYPEFTGLPERSLPDTRRVTAVQGTRLEFQLQLNKPVVSAMLVSTGNLAIALSSGNAASNQFRFQQTLERSFRARLLLTDEAGRTNPVPELFVVEVFTNRAPELKLLAPRGDSQASPLEEVRFRGETADDFGLQAYGLAYTLGDGETRSLELGRGGAAHEKRSLESLLPLEDLGARADQLLSYYLWAEDLGPDGQPRRTTSDLFFIEIRPFEEIYRENSGAASNESGGGEAGAGEGGPTAQLAELQKDILNATWNLMRRETAGTGGGGFLQDLATIRDAQADAREQAEAMRAQAVLPAAVEILEEVESAMDRALDELAAAGKENSASLLPPAVSSEQAAYQGLLKLQSREHEVTRGRSNRGRGSARGNRQQRQLDQLELRQSENRYETAREATPEPDAAQGEQLRLLNRLKELARRQQDLNQQLQELQAALAAARTEEEREEIRRRLKRLREEEQEILADVDELRQRTERPENRSRLEESRQRLEQTREDVQRAAEAMEEGGVSQALAAGQRAREQLEQTRESLRRDTAARFGDDLRQLRQEARRVAEEQQNVSRELERQGTTTRPTLGDAQDRDGLAERLERQSAAVTNVLQTSRRISEDAEASEPILSRQLQDTYREAVQQDAANLPELLQHLLEQGQLRRDVYDLLRQSRGPAGAQSPQASSALLRDGHPGEAQRLSQMSAEDLAQLRQGIERAAQGVIGDDLEALRRARGELEDLNRQLDQEIAQATSGSDTNAAASTPGPPAASNQASPPSSQQAGSRGSRETQGQAQNEAADRTPGQGREQSQAQAQGQGQGQSQSQQPDQEQANAGDRPEGSANGGGARFFESGGTDAQGRFTSGPLTGLDYRDWSERLANVEDLVEVPDLKEDLARIRDRVRNLRIEFKRHGRPPEWDLVRTQVSSPLAEVRQRIDEEIARRQSPDALVPIDRDPVPERYQEVVRRYYEELGK